MSSYRGTADRPDKAVAIVAVIAIHAVLAIVILSGLDVRNVREAVDRMTTIAINEPPPPPPIQQPKPAVKPQAMKKPEGAAAKQAQPTPVVAPQPKLPVPSPIPAAKVAGAGSSTASGAALAGSSTGAGGSGTGAGGGGTGDYSGYTPARLIRNLSRGDYRSITGGALPVGSADAAIVISASGSVSDCRLIRSSGDPAVDSRLCPLIRQRLWFRPALDASGRPIDVRTNFHASWSLGY